MYIYHNSLSYRKWGEVSIILRNQIVFKEKKSNENNGLQFVKKNKDKVIAFYV